MHQNTLYKPNPSPQIDKIREEHFKM